MLGLVTIQNPALPQDLVETQYLGAVGIFSGLALGMVLPMNGDPLFRYRGCCQPEPKAEKNDW